MAQILINMDVAKKTKQADGSVKAVKSGSVPVTIFDLSCFHPSLPAADKTEEDGTPGYSIPAVQWVMKAVTALTKASARNDLKTDATGSTIAKTVEELIAEGERIGGGVYMALNKEFVAAFASFLASRSGKSAAVQAIFNGLVSLQGRKTIHLAEVAARNGLSRQVAAFIETLSADDVTRFESILTAISEGCEGEAEALDY